MNLLKEISVTMYNLNRNIRISHSSTRLLKIYLLLSQFNVNITLKNVKSVATTGVKRISVGSITHSAPAMDFKLEI